VTASSRASLVRELLVASQDVLLERVAALEAAALHLLTRGPLPEPVRRDARRTAHQLVSLGVFGVPRGGELAGRAEALLAADPADPGEEGADLATLVERIRTELQQALVDPPDEPDAGPRSSWTPSARPDSVDVLVVEDDPVLVQLLERALDGAGWSVRVVTDGPAALAAVEVAPEQRPRLVLLDIDLPALDGFGVLRGMAARGVLPGVQVLCLTARASEPDVLSVLSLGAVDHVAKPFSLPVLLARVSRALGGR
jgi:CheY-like chemotaxis protein